MFRNGSKISQPFRCIKKAPVTALSEYLLTAIGVATRYKRALDNVDRFLYYFALYGEWRQQANRITKLTTWQHDQTLISAFGNKRCNVFWSRGFAVYKIKGNHSASMANISNGNVDVRFLNMAYCLVNSLTYRLCLLVKVLALNFIQNGVSGSASDGASTVCTS